MAQTQTTQAQTYHCFKCGKDKPMTREHFYFRSDGTIISGCKECHSRLAKERRNGAAAAAEAQTALGIVEDARPTPVQVQYRCEGCGRSAMSASEGGPRGWKRARLTPGEDPATLCPRCTAYVTRAFQVAEAVATRRAHGRGRAH